MRRVVHLLSGVAILLSAAWLYFSRDFEPLLTFVGSIIAFLSSFGGSTPEPIPPQAAVKLLPGLSGTADRVLSEIDASDESDPKGVSLMMMGSTVGYYRPFIWDNHLQGGISDHDGYDPSGTVSAVDELVDSGFLIPHHVGRSLLQWRRTTKRRS
jgi:hypothetical protein